MLRTAVYRPVHEDSSTESTKQFVSAVEFGKKSIKACSLEKDLFPAMLHAGLKLYGVPFKQNFIDIGVPADYYRAADIILNKAGSTV